LQSKLPASAISYTVLNTDTSFATLTTDFVHALQPAYEEVCSGRTGHTEAVLVFYDSKEVHYKQLLDVFFGRIDPTQVSISTYVPSGYFFGNKACDYYCYVVVIRERLVKLGLSSL
jgi:Peptide methionine sulfoxide reductase